MTSLSATAGPSTGAAPGPVRVAPSSATARKAGFVADLLTIAGRALRSIPREPEAIIPALIIPVFFFVVNIGSVGPTLDRVGLDGKAFQVPVAIIFAVTGISRASALVTDIQGGYFDRLLMTPVRRLTLLLGLMIADFALVVALSLPVVILGLALGVRFDTGILGIVAFVLLAGAWGLAFTGFPYAIALKTGNPAAVNSSFILFFPFAFLTTSFLPRELLSGWLDTVAGYNPVTYLLEGLRALIYVGWDGAALAKAVLAVAAVGAVSMTFAFLALRGRISQR